MLERKLEAIRFLGGKVISLIDNPEEVAMQHAAVQVPDLTSPDPLKHKPNARQRYWYKRRKQRPA